MSTVPCTEPRSPVSKSFGKQGSCEAWKPHRVPSPEAPSSPTRPTTSTPSSLHTDVDEPRAPRDPAPRPVRRPVRPGWVRKFPSCLVIRSGVVAGLSDYLLRHNRSDTQSDHHDTTCATTNLPQVTPYHNAGCLVDMKSLGTRMPKMSSPTTFTMTQNVHFIQLHFKRASEIAEGQGAAHETAKDRHDVSLAECWELVGARGLGWPLRRCRAAVCVAGGWGCGQKPRVNLVFDPRYLVFFRPHLLSR